MLGDKGLKAKVRPPRLGGARVGLFSTRTPHRPNPIGATSLSYHRHRLLRSLRRDTFRRLRSSFFHSFFRAGLTIAKIERLERGVLHISGVDLVDGTPVLDIKPYLPRYDSLPHAAGVARAQPHQRSTPPDRSTDCGHMALGSAGLD